MSLHIQMSEEAEAKLRKDALRSKLTSFGAMAALILFGGAILYFTVVLIAIEAEAEFIGYTPPAENLPARAVPTTQQLSSKASTPSNTVSPSVIVATGAAPVAMAQVDIPMEDSQDEGMSVDIGMGLDAGLGDELGSDGGGLGGAAGGSALEGTFYDLKQSKGKVSTGINLVNGQLDAPSRGKVHAILSEFIKNWSPAVLNKYYTSPTKLYASNFCLPSCSASYAPVAYQCDKDCKPSAWVVVYRGKVKAPRKGTFRFLGTGDDLLAIKFKGQTVLEAGWCIPSTYDKDHPDSCGTRGGMKAGGQTYWENIKSGKDKKHKNYKLVTFKNTPKWNNELGGLTAGDTFTVREGEVCPIEIMISEVPGGAFGFCVLLEDMSKPGKYVLFRTNFSMPKEAELKTMLKGYAGALEIPEFAPEDETPIWTAVP